MSYAKWELGKCACPRYLSDECIVYRTGRDLRGEAPVSEDRDRCECSCHDEDEDEDATERDERRYFSSMEKP